MTWWWNRNKRRMKTDDGNPVKVIGIGRQDLACEICGCYFRPYLTEEAKQYLKRHTSIDRSEERAMSRHPAKICQGPACVAEKQRRDTEAYERRAVLEWVDRHFGYVRALWLKPVWCGVLYPDREGKTEYLCESCMRPFEDHPKEVPQFCPDKPKEAEQ